MPYHEGVYWFSLRGWGDRAGSLLHAVAEDPDPWRPRGHRVRDRAPEGHVEAVTEASFITSAHSVPARSNLIRKRLEMRGSSWTFHEQESSLPLAPTRLQSPGEQPLRLMFLFSPPQPALW